MKSPHVAGPIKEHKLAVVVGIALFIAAVWILIHQIGALGPARVAEAFREERGGVLWLALSLVALNYFALTWHDQLAMAYVGRRIPRVRVAIASFVGFAVSNTVGFGVVSGATVRYRFYARWDVKVSEMSRIVAFYSGAIWLGLLVLGGLSLALDPPPALIEIVPLVICRAAGVLLMSLAAGYVLTCAARQAPIRIARFELPLPTAWMATAQLIVSTIDWMLAAAILYPLLPAPRPSYFAVAGAFTAAQLVGLASHVPGSIGVFEGLIVLFLGDVVDPGPLIQALVLFRVLYYFVPLVVGLLILVVHEGRKRAPRSRVAVPDARR